MAKKNKKRGKKKKNRNMKPGTNPHAHRADNQNRQTQQNIAQPANIATGPTVRPEPTQSLAQKRARHALGVVNSITGGDYGNYVSYIKAIPATIIMLGLGQALAIEKAGAKKDKGHKLLYKHMNSWLCNHGNNGWENSPYYSDDPNRNWDVLRSITTKQEADYIRAQAEALEYLEWLKKFAVAFLEKEGDSQNDTGDDNAAA